MEATVTISQEKFEALIEAKTKLAAVARGFEKHPHIMSLDEFYNLTGFEIPKEVPNNENKN